jgi:hypothetical protein
VKSPYTPPPEYSCDDIRIVDYAKKLRTDKYWEDLGRSVRFRAAKRARRQRIGGLLLGFAINALLWILGISVGYYCWQVFGPYVKDLASWAWELVQ